MTVTIEKAPPVVTVLINRPEVKNAVDRDTAARLAEEFRDFEADDSLDVAVLGGTGGTFCAGADLGSIAAGRGNRVNQDGDGPMGPTRMRLSKPVIAAVSGWCMGGGSWYALACHMTYAAEDAVFAQPEVRMISNTNFSPAWKPEKLRTSSDWPSSSGVTV